VARRGTAPVRAPLASRAGLAASRRVAVAPRARAWSGAARLALRALAARPWACLLAEPSRSAATRVSGGAVISWGGAGPDGTDACALYCTAYAKICPQAGLGTPDECTEECVASLQLDSAACAIGKRDAYECIGNAMLQAPGDCSKALITAKQLCGSATPQVSACNASCVASSVYGGGADGCHATAVCNGVEVDLHCQDVEDDVPCTCSIDRKPIWDIATGFEHSKLGCIDDAMFRLCARELL
jgi:hypothetical protein